MSLICLWIVLLIAAYTDCHCGKIPNWLILAGITAGIMCFIITKKPPWNPLFYSMAILFLFYPFFPFGALGAGDIKLFALLGLFLPPEQIIYSLLFTFLIAAGIALAGLLHRNFFPTLRKQNICSKRKKIHLALPLLLGVLAVFGGKII